MHSDLLTHPIIRRYVFRVTDTSNNSTLCISSYWHIQQFDVMHSELLTHPRIRRYAFWVTDTSKNSTLCIPIIDKSNNSTQCIPSYWHIQRFDAMHFELLKPSLNNLQINNFFPPLARYPSGPGPPHCRGFVIELRQATIGKLLWMSDQLVAEASTWQLTTLRDRHLCPRRESSTKFSVLNFVHFRLNNDQYFVRCLHPPK